jgi:MIP family channel proteins
MLHGTRREAAAEFLGTFILIVFGVGVVAQTVLSRGANGSYLAINLGWGLAVMLGVYVAAGVSGAHLNPAVTLALAVARGFPWAKVPVFVMAQMAGAFAASAIVYLTYREAFAAFDGGSRQVTGALATAGIFATYPQPFLSTMGGFVDQVVGTALLMATILAVTDQRNTPTPPWLTPVVVGAIVVAIGVAFGFNAGYAINPARDLGPRLFTAVAGWGGEVFTAARGWWWVPVVAPCAGAVAGAFAYDLLIVRQHPPASVTVGAPGAERKRPESPAELTQNSPASEAL